MIPSVPCCSLSLLERPDCETLKVSNILRSRVEPASGGAKTPKSTVKSDRAAVAETESRKSQLQSCFCDTLGGSSRGTGCAVQCNSHPCEQYVNGVIN